MRYLDIEIDFDFDIIVLKNLYKQ